MLTRNIALTSIIVFFSLLASVTAFPSQVEAQQQTCSGSISCYEWISDRRCSGGTNDGRICTSSGDCPLGRCTEQGGEERVDGGSCPGGIMNWGSSCGGYCNPGLRTVQNCSAVPVYPPPAPAPPPPSESPPPFNVDPEVMTYMCNMDQCVEAGLGGTGYTDSNCSGACTPNPPPPLSCEELNNCPCSNCVRYECEPSPYDTLHHTIVQPGETITWETHRAGDLTNRATRLSSTATYVGVYQPESWSSYTSPGDALTVIARAQGSWFHVGAFEIQLLDEFNQPVKYFFPGPQNSTYMLTPEEFEEQRLINSNQDCCYFSDNEITFRIPFGAFMHPWVNCASLIQPPDFCGPRRFEDGVWKGGYFGMEQDIYWINEPPDFWCNSNDRYACRKDGNGWLREEVKNPLAHSSWWREQIIQIPISEMYGGRNKFMLKVAGVGGETRYSRLEVCPENSVGEIFYYENTEVDDYLQAQARCDDINIMDNLSREVTLLEKDTIMQVGRGRWYEISGTYRGRTKFYNMPYRNFESSAVNTTPFGWTGTGFNVIPTLTLRCENGDCSAENSKYLEVTASNLSDTAQWAVGPWVDPRKTLDGEQLHLVFDARTPADAGTELVIPSPSLERLPNHYREPQGLGRYITNYESPKVTWFTATRDRPTWVTASVNSTWKSYIAGTSWPVRSDIKGPWHRDTRLSSTAVRPVLRLASTGSQNRTVHYRNIELSTDPSPESVDMFIKAFPSSYDVNKIQDGSWRTDLTLYDHFTSSVNWIRMTLDRPYIASTFKMGDWQVPASLATGYYLYSTNITNGYIEINNEDAICAGHPFANYSDVSRPIYADCSETCGKVFEVVDCETSVAPIESISSTSGPVEIWSNLEVNYSSSTGKDTYPIIVEVSTEHADFKPEQKVELMIVKQGSTFAMPSGAVDPTSLPSDVQYFAPVEGVDAGIRYRYDFTIEPKEQVGPSIAIYARTSIESCETLYSPWSSVNGSLKGEITGEVRVVTSPSDVCSSGALISNNNDYTVVASHDPSSLANRQVTTSSSTFNLRSISNRPVYRPTATWLSRVSGLSINYSIGIADSDDRYVCVSGDKSPDGTRCLYKNFPANFLTPSSGNPIKPLPQFCFIRSNIAYDSWWQARGGMVFSKDTMTSKLPIRTTLPPIPTSNCSDTSNTFSCQPYLLAKRLTSDTSTGIPITHSNSIGVPSSWLSDNVFASTRAEISGTTTPFNAQQITTFSNMQSLLDKMNSDTFISLGQTNLISSSNGEPFSNLTQANRYSVDPASNMDIYVFESSGNSSLSFSNNASVNIPENTAVIFIVNGNFEVLTTNTVQRVLITVPQSSFFAVFASQNIGFHSAVGHIIESTVDWPTTNTPVIEGVYVAGGQLQILSTSSDERDRKFVGAGIFAGLGGVELQRNFETSNELDREYNTKTPTEMFIHRPDFVLNTPRILTESTTTWQEVN